ncbi:MAG: hypothetical protein KDJ17_07700, partial [Hyphomicrobiaceae bacterium]|nr:hypothetical protein [Hyphomicrobiaceae bacterium]
MRGLTARRSLRLRGSYCAPCALIVAFSIASPSGAWAQAATGSSDAADVGDTAEPAYELPSVVVTTKDLAANPASKPKAKKAPVSAQTSGPAPKKKKASGGGGGGSQGGGEGGGVAADTTGQG